MPVSSVAFSANSSTAEVQRVAAGSVMIDPTPQDTSVTLRAEAVAQASRDVFMRVLGSSGASFQKKIPEGKIQATKEKFEKIQTILTEKKLIPEQRLGVCINPALKLARYKDEDGHLREVSLLSLYLTDLTFQGDLDQFHAFLNDAMDISGDSRLLQCNFSKAPMRSLRRTWQDHEVIKISHRLEQLQGGSLSPEQTTEKELLEKRLSRFTLHNEKYFSREVDKQTPPTEAPHKTRWERAKKLYKTLEEYATSSVAAEKKRLLFDLQEVDGYALQKALQDTNADELFAEVEREYRKNIEKHQKEDRALLAPYDSSYAVDVAAIHLEEDQKVTFYGRHNKTQRAPSLIDKIYEAVKKCDDQNAVESEANSLVEFLSIQEARSLIQQALRDS